MTLRTQAAHGVLTSATTQGAKWSLQIVSLVVLARMLGPADFGLAAMVLVVVGLGEVLRDFGLTTATIQASNISPQQRSNLFWLNAGIGSALCVSLILLADPLANVYGRDELAPLSRLVAFTVLLNGLGSQYRADLVRSMRFVRLGVCDVVSQSVALVIAVAIAQGGGGYWALGWQPVAQASVALIGFFFITRWIPERPRKAPMGALLGFAWPYATTQLLVYMSANLMSVVIGRNLGATQLGLFNRAQQLCALPLSQVSAAATQVAIPALSKVQRDPDRIRRYWLTGSFGLCLPLVSMFGLMALTADPLVPMVLGRSWADAVPLVQVLAIGSAAQTLGFPTFWYLVATGRTASNLRFALLCRPLLIVATISAATISTFACAVAVAAGAALMWVVGICWIRRFDKVGARQQLATGLMIAATSATAGGLAIIATMAWTDNLLHLGARIFIYAVASLCLCLVVGPLRRASRDAILGFSPTRRLG